MNRLKLIALVLMATLTASSYAALPVTAGADQQAMLQSDNPQEAANKKIAYDFFRVVLRGLRLDRAKETMHVDYMQHNPNAETGLQGFLDYFTAVLGDSTPPAIPDELPGLVAIQAEGEYVTLSFVRECTDTPEPYTTTWFDMFRVVDGMIVEHWDSALKGAGSNC